jgi:hypothetical protein
MYEQSSPFHGTPLLVIFSSEKLRTGGNFYKGYAGGEEKNKILTTTFELGYGLQDVLNYDAPT